MKPRLFTLVAVLTSALVHANPPEDLSNERLPPTIASELAAPLTAPVPPPPGALLGAFSNAPFFRDTEFSLRPQLYYRYIDAGHVLHEAFTAGGALGVTTGWWRDTLQLGLTSYTTQPLAAPRDRSNTGLLRANSDGFCVLGQAWAKLRAGPASATFFRQALDLPFINAYDALMIPNTFEAYGFDVKPSEYLHFGFGYVARMKTRTSPDFKPMSEIAGAPDTQHGTTVGGFLLGSEPKTYLGAINECTADLFNSLYIQAGHTSKLTHAIEVRGDLQFLDQRSVGQELIGPIASQLYGARLAASYCGAVLTLAFTHTTGATSFHPFGVTSAFNSLMISDFDQAREKTYQIGLSYDFAQLGLTGVSAFGSYVHGVLPAGNNEDEADATVDYHITNGALKNIWLRLRYARNRQRDTFTTEEFRAILNYTVAF